MEKVIIKGTVNTGLKTKNDAPIINVTLEDGRTGSAFTLDALNWSGEMDLNVSPQPILSNGTQKYWFNPVKPKTKFFQKDITFEKRKASLQLSIETAATLKNTATTAEILVLATKYYEYLNKQ